jgi:CHAD domain-containing protein
VSSFVRDKLAERLEKLDSEFHVLAEKPSDPDSIHHVRVAIRRLSQCLRQFSNCFDLEDAAKLQRRARRLLKRCGAVRDCDIALQLLTASKVRDAALKKSIEEQRAVALHELTTHIEKLKTKRAWKDWPQRLTIVSPCGEQPEEIAQRLLPAMLKEWMTAGDKAAKSESHKSLHRFRLLGKRLRYTLELFADQDPQVEPRLKLLREVQDRLGAINDCAATLPKFKGHPRAEAALTKLLRSRESEFRASWKSTSSATAKPSRRTKASPTKTAS